MRAADASPRVIPGRLAPLPVAEVGWTSKARQDRVRIHYGVLGAIHRDRELQ
jgi:hypothetical protein